MDAPVLASANEKVLLTLCAAEMHERFGGRRRSRGPRSSIGYGWTSEGIWQQQHVRIPEGTLKSIFTGRRRPSESQLYALVRFLVPEELDKYDAVAALRASSVEDTPLSLDLDELELTTREIGELQAADRWHEARPISEWVLASALAIRQYFPNDTRVAHVAATSMHGVAHSAMPNGDILDPSKAIRAAHLLERCGAIASRFGFAQLEWSAWSTLHQHLNERHRFDPRLYGTLDQEATRFGPFAQGIRIELRLQAVTALLRAGNVLGAFNLMRQSERAARQCGHWYSLACFLKNYGIVSAIAGQPLLACLALVAEAREVAGDNASPLLRVRFDIADLRILVIKTGQIDEKEVRRARRDARKGKFPHQLQKLEDTVDAVGLDAVERRAWAATIDP